MGNGKNSIKRRCQPRLANGLQREQLPACVLDEIYEAVNELAKEYNISRSWVVSVLLAESLGIRTQPHFIKKRGTV